MSTVIVGGGGPRPQARIVTVTEEGAPLSTYEIRDGDAILAWCPKRSHAEALLPLIQRGD